MTFEEIIVGGGLGAIVAALATFLTYATSRRANRTDSLAKASESWQSFSEKMEERVETLEKKIKGFQDELDTLKDRYDRVLSENRSLHRLLADVEQWLIEVAEWEREGRHGTPPHSASQIHQRIEVLKTGLSSLTPAIREEHP